MINDNVLVYAISKLIVVSVLCLEHGIDCIRGMKHAEANIDTVTAAACTRREMCSLATGVALVVYLRCLCLRVWRGHC
jgi:branched-subunit amino acid transport protein